jgi:hypothetical protein
MRHSDSALARVFDEESDPALGIWNLDWLSEVMHSPLPMELSNSIIEQPPALPVHTQIEQDDNARRIKSKQFSKSLCKVWINTVQTLLKLAFKKHRIDTYFKTALKV